MDGTNIFGDDTSESLDLSDDALESRWEAESNFIEESDEDGNLSGEEEVVEEEESENDTESEDDSEEEESELELPDKLKGKSAEDIAKMYLELERSRGTQSTEIGDLRKLVEQQAAQLAQIQAGQKQPEEDLGLLAAPDISDYIVDRSSATTMYHQALEALDKQAIHPALVDEIIEAARAVDPRLAAQMDRDFGMRLARTEIMAQMEPFQQTAKESALRQATDELYRDPTLGPDIQAYEQDIVEVLKGRDLGNTPAQIKDTLRQALVFVRGQDPTKSTLYQKQLEASKQNAQVEQGENDTSPPPTEEDRIRKQIFTGRTKSGGSQLFAGFGGN